MAKISKFGAKEFTLASSLAIITSLAASQRVMAQEEATAADEGESLEEVVVYGIRQNLSTAQDLKRDSDTFVDSITAEDIGSLPDRSVLEAIQRLPGVSIERFAGPDDPDHFSAEGSGAIIRGMTATRSEFNGRDSFTANSGRGLSFNDVSPELMGGVDVFKNQTADMIEGGIGGTISLRTRKPFDQDGRKLAANLDYSYGDIAEEWTPTYSGLYSDRWDIGGNELGFLINFAKSELRHQTHGIQSDAFVQYYARDLAGAERFITPENPDAIVWIPNASNLLMKDDLRERTGIATALQFQNEDETFLSTFQYIRSDAKLAWNERAVKYQGGYQNIDNRKTRALEGTLFTFDDDGFFESGTLALGTDGWRGGPYTEPYVAKEWTAPGFPQWGQNTQMDSRVKETNTLVEDFALNLQWNVSDQLMLEGDIQFIQAETQDDDLAIHLNTWAIQQYNVTGDTPGLTLLEPFNGKRDANPEMFADNWPGFSDDPMGDQNYFSDTNSYWWRSAMDHYERSDGESLALRLDATYDIEDFGIMKSIKSGVRYANRQQTVRSTDWNWGSLQPEYNQADNDLNGSGYIPDVPSQQDAYEFVDWSDFMGGGVVNIQGNQTIHANEAFIRSVMGANPSRMPVQNESGDWETQAQQAGVDSEYGLFEPNEINDVEETNNAFYVRADFESDGDLRFSGNFGFRYVTLNRVSNGYVSFPDLIPEDAAPDGYTLPLTTEAAIAEVMSQIDPNSATLDEDYKAAYTSAENAWLRDRLNYLSDTERAFGNNASARLEADADFSMFLPSFNIKFELTDDLIARFALAKAVSMPDISAVRNNVNIGVRSTETYIATPILGGELYAPEDADDPDFVPDDNAVSHITGAYTTGWQGSGANGSAGNPYLRPMESVQYDLSLEWYFADVGQLTGTIFHKDLSNMFVQGANYQSFTNPVSGVTQLVDVTSTRNGGDAKMDGFEIAYQQTYDFLPEPFDGFGTQVSYTYIDASGVPNNEVDADDPDNGFAGDENVDTGIRVSLDNVPLQGQSDETYSIVGFWEKYDVSARLAYTWRSRYLLTTRDVISKAPLWNDAYGQLDGSVFYNVTDSVKLGLQATNLLNTQTKTIMVVNNQGQEAGRSWFVSDRRVALVLQADF